jgi:putative (di)nucleoside polyphosphate hydrolase
VKPLPAAALDLRPYRFNVGIALFSRRGLVWLGRVISDGPEYVLPGYEWQMPQGGIDPHEDLIVAMTESWWRYNFPAPIGPSSPHKLDAFRGQQQRWVAFRFTGDDTDIRLDGKGLDFKPEFSVWRWASLDEAVQGVMPYKQAVYRQMAEAFRPLTRGA